MTLWSDDAKEREIPSLLLKGPLSRDPSEERLRKGQKERNAAALHGGSTKLSKITHKVNH